ncbi:L-Aspartase-like protein [Xylariales sp. AK1849]|nr:L-Aspartase-like protein [Xylariales sp. AK1849]
MARDMENTTSHNAAGLAQDRYALRSTPQWIGPQLEDLMSARGQIPTALNSSADNPIVDVDAKEVYYGANFQAAAVMAAMEETRLALQMVGRLFFAQTGELIDPSHNNGLQANLVADDPSTSCTMNGVDIDIATYIGELGLLTNPVSTHVQKAEMHTQSINSLALLSARMTNKAVEMAIGDAAILSLLAILESGNISHSTTQAWRSALEAEASAVWKTSSVVFIKAPTTESYLGCGSGALYRKIRTDLKVPFHEGISEHPGTEDLNVYGEARPTISPKKTIESLIAIVYQALLKSKIYDAM